MVEGDSVPKKADGVEKGDDDRVAPLAGEALGIAV